MRRFFTSALGAWTLLAAVLTGMTNWPVAAADEAFRQADHSLAEALAKGDRKTASALLDENFQWVESDGKSHTRAARPPTISPTVTGPEADSSAVSRLTSTPREIA